MSGITSKEWITKVLGRSYASTKNKEAPTVKKEDEEWIWVDGFKGTDSDMTCRGYQFGFDKIFEMPEGAEIKTCESGFHLCLNTEDVYGYYPIGVNHRYFAVRALVRKADADMYGCWDMTGPGSRINKIAAKAIEFIRELDDDEVFTAYPYVLEDWTNEDKKTAREFSVEYAEHCRKVRILKSFGFSEELAKYFIDTNRTDIAMAVGSQPDLSMDVKCRIIFGG